MLSPITHLPRHVALLASLFALACASFAFAGSAEAATNPVGQGSNWNLILDDGFDGDALNPGVWWPFRPGGPIFDLPFNPPLESARYSPENVAVHDGTALLRVSRDKTSHRFPYRSGVIQSSGLFKFTYGYVEARVKLPRCFGCWPAFWMLEEPTAPREPSNTEVDIFEFFSTQRLRQPYFNFHWNQFSAEAGIQRYGRKKADYTRGYHTYGLLWKKDLMQVFVDGRPGPNMSGGLVPDVDMYVLLNLAVFRGGRPRPNSRMAVDYVRVWQRP